MVTKEIKRMCIRLAKTLKPEKILLFGSYARDDYDDESDYDICILLSDQIKKTSHLMQEAQRAVGSKRNKGVDLYITNKSRFYDRAKFSTIEQEILKEGIILYDREKFNSGIDRESGQ